MLISHCDARLCECAGQMYFTSAYFVGKVGVALTVESLLAIPFSILGAPLCLSSPLNSQDWQNSARLFHVWSTIRGKWRSLGSLPALHDGMHTRFGSLCFRPLLLEL